MLNDIILEKYIHNFFGYGNLNSSFWFISLEEGGVNSAEEIQRRLNTWNNRGCKELEECRSFHLEFGKGEWFGLIENRPQKARLQSTWKMYIRLFFYATNDQKFIGKKNNEQKEIIRRYQRDNFGKLNGDMSIMELRPLPSKSQNEWIYNTISKLDYLQDRDIYKKHIDNHRIKKLKNLIETYNPKYVVFFSTAKNIRSKWSKIIDAKIDENLELGFCFFSAKKNKTNYFIVEHAVAHDYLINANGDRKNGLDNAYFNKIGEFINKRT